MHLKKCWHYQGACSGQVYTFFGKEFRLSIILTIKEKPHILSANCTFLSCLEDTN
jgi:hypothetical protein